MKSKETNEKPNQQKFLTWITIVFAITLLLIAVFSYYLVFLYPENQVSQLGITNTTEKVNFINQYRTTSIQLISTLAQILGGGAVLLGLYFAWKNFELAQATLKSDKEKSQKDLEVALATLKSNQEKSQKDFELAQATLKHNQEASQKNLEVAIVTLESNMKNAQENLKIDQEGQITERFTRAVDQLGAVDKDGNPAIEIRLGGIYALERIAKESKEDYWPIMEILTAYVRKNSPVEIAEIQDNVSLDIQAILTVIGRSKDLYESGELDKLDLCKTFLRQANLTGFKLQGTTLVKANLTKADLAKADLAKADLTEAILDDADLTEANLTNANLLIASLRWTDLSKSNLLNANLRGACFHGTLLLGANLTNASLIGSHLIETNLERANFEGADLEGANLYRANLTNAHNLSLDQLSKVSTLYRAQLDKELFIRLREKYPALFEYPFG